MTLEELQAKREEILNAMSQPAEVRFRDRGVVNRDYSDLAGALAHVDSEIAQLTGTDSRLFTVQTKRGL